MTATEPDDGPIGEVPPAVLAYESRLDVTRAEVVRLTGERDAARGEVERLHAVIEAISERAAAEARVRWPDGDPATTAEWRATMRGEFMTGAEFARAAMSSDVAPQAAGVTREVATQAEVHALPSLWNRASTILLHHPVADAPAAPEGERP